MRIFRTKYNWLNFWLDVAVMIFVGSAIMFVFFWPTRVVGNSMAPTLNHGDQLIVSRFIANFGNLAAEDIVLLNVDGNTIIKRLVAIPGDHVKLTQNVLYINGLQTDLPLFGEALADVDITLYDGQYFVLGDNLLHSRDSRYFGVVEKRQIIAKVLLKYFPITDINFY